MAKGYRILFSDLDATLLDDKKGMEPGTGESIEKMLAEGLSFAICTGRPLASAKAVARQFGLDKEQCYIIAYNGGVIYDPAQDKVLSYDSIPLPIVRRMFQEAESEGLYIHTYDRCSDTVLTYRHSRELEAYTGHTKLPAKTGMDVLGSLTGEPAKMIAISLTDTQKLKQFEQKNEGWVKGQLNSVFSCEQYLEYCPAGVSKGAAACRLCGYLGIPVREAVAVGDERNDISMLKAVGLGAAPANAFWAAKEAAGYVCAKDNNAGAVGEIIQKYIL